MEAGDKRYDDQPYKGSQPLAHPLPSMLTDFGTEAEFKVEVEVHK